MKKIDSKTNESTVQEVHIAIPPDGGYAWVIVIGAFLSNFVVDGISFSFGISLMDALPKVLGETEAKISTISSVQLGSYYLFGPIACAFVNHFGFRTVGVFGCIVAFIGIFVASCVESYYVILSFYGIIGGIGFGMIYTSSIICVGYYFEKYRALATGIAVCGSSVGALCLSPLFVYLVNEKAWDFTMRIQSALLLICLLSSIAYRPLKPTQVPLTPEIITEIDQLSTHHVDFVELYKTNSMVSIDLREPSEESRHFPQIAIISSRFLPISQLAENKKRKRCSCSWIRNLCLGKKTEGNDKQNVILTGPVDRKDIFYSASVVHLPEYKNMKRNESRTHSRMLSYHLSMIIHPKDHKSKQSAISLSKNNSTVAVGENSTHCFRVSLIHKALEKLFDISLLKSFVFCIIALACFFYALAWMTPYNYMKERGKMNKIEESYTTWFTFYISIGNGIGRIVAGLLPTIFPQLNSSYLVGSATMFAGIITVLSALAWTDSIQFQIIYCVIFGFCIAFLSALRAVIFVKLLGLDKLTNAFGLSAVIIGCGALSGLPIASASFESDGTLTPAFVLCGIFFIISGLLLIFAFHVYLWEERKKIIKK